MFGVSGLRACQLTRADGDGWRPRARLRFLVWGWSWVSGHVAGGLLVGGLLGALGVWCRAGPQGPGWLGLVCLAGAVRELGVVRLPLPCWRRQVDRGWMWRLPWDLVAFGYGLQLGCGVATRVKIATTYAAMGCALLSGSPLRGALVMGAFGMARAIPPVLMGPRLVSPTQSLAFSRIVHGREEQVRRLNGWGLLAASLVFIDLWWQRPGY